MITEKLIKIFVKNYKDTSSIRVRTQCGLLEAWVSIIGNLLLGCIKLAFGISTNCIALTADAFHTLGDMITSIIVLFGFRIGKQPSDLGHPYGHGRAEPIGTLIIAVLLIITGVEFVHIAIDRLRAPIIIKNTNWIFIIMAFSVIFKEWLARFSFYLGKLINSKILETDAWHHRSDVYASALVILAAVGSIIGYPRLDGLFALFIAVLILWVGFSIAKSIVSFLIGEAPSKEMLDKISSTAQGIKGVKGIHGIEIHDYGQTKVCSVHIEVSPRLTTTDSHEIAEAVEQFLKEKLGLSPVVHVDVSGQKKS